MEIREKLMSDMKDAMRAKDSLKLEAIRFLQSAIKYKEVEVRPNAITADDVLGVIKKLVKQRKESIEQFKILVETDQNFAIISPKYAKTLSIILEIKFYCKWDILRRCI